MKDMLQKTLKTEWFLTKLMFQTDIRLGIIYWLISGMQYAIPLVSVWIWKLILDELTTVYLECCKQCFVAVSWNVSGFAGACIFFDANKLCDIPKD